jgi:deoxyribonuclease-4
MRFGVHLSISGGLRKVPERGREIGCQTFQIFCGNPRGWTKKTLEAQEAGAFREAREQTGLNPVIVHATYLINLASPEEEVYRSSVASFIHELQNAAQLGAAFYVIHPGSHKGMGEEEGRRRVAQALDRARGEVAGCPTILLELTAGSQHSLGSTFQDMARLLDLAKPTGLAACFDTCHALAAGYEIRTSEGVGRTLDEFDRTLSLTRLGCLHINDSKGDLGSKLDRHEHIGLGKIGDEGFQAFFADRRLWSLPAILETPVDDPDDDQRNLWRAIELAAQAGAIDQSVLERMPTAALEPIGERRKTKPGSAVPPKLRTPSGRTSRRSGVLRKASGRIASKRPSPKGPSSGLKPRQGRKRRRKN